MTDGHEYEIELDRRPDGILQALHAQSVLTRIAATMESRRRLAENKVNLNFFKLVTAWQTGNEAIASESYNNLRRMAMASLYNAHTPLERTQPNAGDASESSSSFNDVFHTVLLSEAQKRLEISYEQNLLDALNFRFAGFLTRLGQRHKDAVRRDRFEHPRATFTIRGGAAEVHLSSSLHSDEDQQEELTADSYLSAPVETDNDGEHVPRFETIPDPRFGCTPKQAEAVALDALEIAEFVKRNIATIEAEIGKAGAQTWRLIAQGIETGTLQLGPLTIAGVRKDMVDLLAQGSVELLASIDKPAARKRLRRLATSETVRRWLMDAIEKNDRLIPDAQPVVRRGRSQRIREIYTTRPANRRTKAKPQLD